MAVALEKTTPVSKSDIPYVHIERMTLYHGSWMEGIKVLLPAIDATVGEGVYFTSQRDKAEYYALLRSKGSVEVQYDRDPGESNRRHVVLHNGKVVPVVYEVVIENMDFVDLRTNEKLKKAVAGFRDYLVENLDSELKELKEKAGNAIVFDLAKNHLLAAIGMMDRLEGRPSEYTEYVSKYAERPNVKPEEIQPRDILHNTGRFFTRYLQGLGFDGIIALEGGEGPVDQFKQNSSGAIIHDTYVLFKFESEKVKITETVKIVKTTTESEVVK